jgi:hypothetical protein
MQAEKCSKFKQNDKNAHKLINLFINKIILKLLHGLFVRVTPHDGGR